MRGRKEAELNGALLQFIAKCIVEEDDATLADLGLDRQDVRAIEALHLTDLEHMATMPVSFLKKSALDRDVIHRLLQWAQSLRDSTHCRDTLLRMDAPFPLMQRYFGMDNAEYAARGWRLQVRRHAGRPSEPSEAEEAHVWNNLVKLGKTRVDALQATDYVILCELTKLPARIVWAVVQRFEASLADGRSARE